MAVYPDPLQKVMDDLASRVTSVRVIFVLDDGKPFWYRDIKARPGEKVEFKVPEPGEIRTS
jgi:hypothetical protein